MSVPLRRPSARAKRTAAAIRRRQRWRISASTSRGNYIRSAATAVSTVVSTVVERCRPSPSSPHRPPNRRSVDIPLRSAAPHAGATQQPKLSRLKNFDCILSQAHARIMKFGPRPEWHGRGENSDEYCAWMRRIAARMKFDYSLCVTGGWRRQRLRSVAHRGARVTRLLKHAIKCSGEFA